MDKKATKKTEIFYSLKELLAATTVGAISFPFALGVIQNFVFKPLRISCKKPNAVVLLFGGTSIVLSGIFASQAFVTSCKAFKNLNLLSSHENTAQHKRFKLKFDNIEENWLIYGFGSLAVFKFFGGKVGQVVPSHLFHPGAFAKVSVSATGKSYAGLSTKRKLNLLGRRYGCHSCGKRKPKDFIADHMPPNKLVKFYQNQVFYPQCKSCSQKQGGALSSSMSNVRAIQTHATTLRQYHIWLPIPFGIATVKSILYEKKGNPKRE